MPLPQKSIDKMAGVDDGVVAVVLRAAQITKQKFIVTFGVRTRIEQYGIWRECHNKDGTRIPGKPWKTDKNGTPEGEMTPEGSPGTGESRHQGGYAVDLAAVKDGQISWDVKLYPAIVEAMETASKEIGVPIRCGAHFKKKDWGHFEKAV